MGTSYQQLKSQGESVVLERQENIVVEQSAGKLVKRKQTLVREKFAPPYMRGERCTRKCREKRERSTKCKTVPNIVVGKSGGGGDSSNDFTQQVESTAVHLERLARQIDNEIGKLKEQRDMLMHDHPNMRRGSQTTKQKHIGIQNNMTWDQNLSANSNYTGKEFCIAKYSRQHKFVCTSPRYSRDEQTSCRPRMRTIGLQKDTQRSNNAGDENTNECMKKSHCVPLSQKTKLKEKKEPHCKDANLGCFDYGSGDAVNIYHLQTCPNTGCRKLYERYNINGAYNGVVCNQQRYLETGVTPCSEYNYCRDEYYYDYGNNCANSLQVCCPRPSTPCTGRCCCCPQTTCTPRPCSDLRTDEFYVRKREESAPPKKKHQSPTPRAKSMKEEKPRKKCEATPERMRECEEQESKPRDCKCESRPPRQQIHCPDLEWEAELREKIRQESAKLQQDKNVCGRRNIEECDSEDTTTSLRQYKVKSKEKLLKITLKKKCRSKAHECEDNLDVLSSGDDNLLEKCSPETLRTLKRMCTNAYRAGQLSKNESLACDDDEEETKAKPAKFWTAKQSPKEGEFERKQKYAAYIDKYKQLPGENLRRKSTPIKESQVCADIDTKRSFTISRKYSYSEEKIDSVKCAKVSRQRDKSPCDYKKETEVQCCPPKAQTCACDEEQKQTQDLDRLGKLKELTASPRACTAEIVKELPVRESTLVADGSLDQCVKMLEKYQQLRDNTCEQTPRSISTAGVQESSVEHPPVTTTTTQQLEENRRVNNDSTLAHAVAEESPENRRHSVDYGKQGVSLLGRPSIPEYQLKMKSHGKYEYTERAHSTDGTLYQDSNGVRYNINRISESTDEQAMYYAEKNKDQLSPDRRAPISSVTMQSSAMPKHLEICACMKRSKIPTYTGCPCMLGKYMKLVDIYCGDRKKKLTICANGTPSNVDF